MARTFCWKAVERPRRRGLAFGSTTAASRSGRNVGSTITPFAVHGGHLDAGPLLRERAEELVADGGDGQRRDRTVLGRRDVHPAGIAGGERRSRDAVGADGRRARRDPPPPTAGTASPIGSSRPRCDRRTSCGCSVVSPRSNVDHRVAAPTVGHPSAPTGSRSAPRTSDRARRHRTRRACPRHAHRRSTRRRDLGESCCPSTSVDGVRNDESAVGGSRNSPSIAVLPLTASTTSSIELTRACTGSGTRR